MRTDGRFTVEVCQSCKNAITCTADHKPGCSAVTYWQPVSTPPGFLQPKDKDHEN